MLIGPIRASKRGLNWKLRYRRINISSLRITITKVLYLYNWIWSSILNKYKEFEQRMVMVQGTNCIFTPRWRQQRFETVVDSVIGLLLCWLLGRTFANAQTMNFVSCICIMYCCVGVVPKKFRSRSSDPPCPSVFRFADKDAQRRWKTR